MRRPWALSFALELTGAHTPSPPSSSRGDRPLSLDLRVRWPIRASRRSTVAGTITAAGIATRQPVDGVLELGTNLRYDLDFTSDDGQRWRLGASQRLSMAGQPASFTVARGAMQSASKRHPIELRLDPRSDLRRVLASLALRRG